MFGPEAFWLGFLDFAPFVAALVVVVVVVVWPGVAGSLELAFCLRLSTTVGPGAPEGAGAPLVPEPVVWVGAVVVAAGVVGVGAVVAGAGGVGVVVVGVVVSDGAVSVGVEDVPVSVPCEPPDSVAGVVLVSPSAEPASGPPMPAAVRPLPASAVSNARKTLRRARFAGVIREGRSSRWTSHVRGRRIKPTIAGHAHRQSYRQRTTNP